MKRAALAAALLAAAVLAVDRSKFRRCDQAGFCRRHRGKTTEPEWRLNAGTVKLAAPGQLAATLHSDAPGSPPFDLAVFFYESGIARVRITENIPDKPPRWEVRACAGASGGVAARAQSAT